MSALSWTAVEACASGPVHQPARRSAAQIARRRPYGSTLGDGRWPIGGAGPLQLVYCGASRALCQRERQLHCKGATPKNLALLRLEVPDTAMLQEAELPADWWEDQAATQAIGMRWLVGGTRLGLWVPYFVESTRVPSQARTCSLPAPRSPRLSRWRPTASALNQEAAFAGRSTVFSPDNGAKERRR